MMMLVVHTLLVMAILVAGVFGFTKLSRGKPAVPRLMFLIFLGLFALSFAAERW